MDQSFPPAARLHDRRDYGRVFHRGVKAHSRHCSIQLAPRPKRGPRRARLGIVVSTKVHKRAVRRHQLKRWVRELFRREFKDRLRGHDCAVVFRLDPPADGHAALDAELRTLLAKALAKLVASSSDERDGTGGRREGTSGGIEPGN